VRGAASPIALQCLTDLKDIQVVCIPPLTAAAAAIHPTLSTIVTGLHDALQFMHQMFVKLYVQSPPPLVFVYLQSVTRVRF
jgi:hypothetical protein